MTDYSQLAQHMRAVRNQFGADTRIGRRASNVIEAIDSLPWQVEAGEHHGWIAFQRAGVDTSIKRQLRDIARFAG